MLSGFLWVSVCIPKVCEYDILRTAWHNFTKFTIWVHLGTNANRLDFEIKGLGYSWTENAPKMEMSASMAP